MMFLFNNICRQSGNIVMQNEKKNSFNQKFDKILYTLFVTGVQSNEKINLKKILYRFHHKLRHKHILTKLRKSRRK